MTTVEMKLLKEAHGWLARLKSGIVPDPDIVSVPLGHSVHERLLPNAAGVLHSGASPPIAAINTKSLHTAAAR